MTSNEREVLGQLRDAALDAADQLPDNSLWRRSLTRYAAILGAAAHLPILGVNFGAHREARYDVDAWQAIVDQLEEEGQSWQDEH